MSDDDLALLLFLSTFCVQRGYPPRYGEVAAARGMTVPAVRETIARLRAEGHLRKLYDQSQRHLRPVAASPAPQEDR